MRLARRWERWEFEQLLRSPGLSDEELADLNGRRSPTAIATMRAAIHGYHVHDRAGRHLTRVQVVILEAYCGLMACALCGLPW